MIVMNAGGKYGFMLLAVGVQPRKDALASDSAGGSGVCMVGWLIAIPQSYRTYRERANRRSELYPLASESPLSPDEDSCQGRSADGDHSAPKIRIRPRPSEPAFGRSSRAPLEPQSHCDYLPYREDRIRSSDSLEPPCSYTAA